MANPVDVNNVVSARGDEKVKVEALDAGADDYLSKPFGTGELLAQIRVAGIPMEDLCQLSQRLTEEKYRSSCEQGRKGDRPFLLTTGSRSDGVLPAETH